MNGTLPVPDLHTQPLTCTLRQGRSSWLVRGLRNIVQRTLVPPECTLGPGLCVSRSVSSQPATFGGRCFFPFPFCLGFTKRENLNLGLGEPGFKTPAYLALSLSSHVTFLR